MASVEHDLLTHEGVLRAALILDGVANRTPVFQSRTLNHRLGAQIFFKGEHLQRCGAFKFRGAYHALSRLGPEARKRGVLTYSSGNHAGGLALAGSILGIPVTVVMPENAIPLKRAAAEEYGAEIVTCVAAERERVGDSIAETRGLTVIPPYDNEAIIAGAGTAGLELIQQVGDLDLLLAPIGGGGLLAGTALAAADKPTLRVIGVEPEIADDACQSFNAQRVITFDSVPETIADGLRTRFVGERNLAVLLRWLDRMVTVSETEIIDALRWLWIRMKLLVEPSGAVAFAPIFSGRIEVKDLRVGIILSGGNADPQQVARLFAEGPPA